MSGNGSEAVRATAVETRFALRFGAP
jgi:hypothetical protein